MNDEELEPFLDAEDLDIDADIDSDADDDFSFEQLSAAYAQVLKQRGGESHRESPDSAEPDSEAFTDDELENDEDSDLVRNATDGLEEVEIDSTSNDNAASPISPKTIVEAILFVGTPQGMKLTTRQIAATLRDVSPQEVSQIIQQLNSDYESENSAFRIINEKGEVKMVLVDSLHVFRQTLFGRNKAVKLNQTAIDVLAVVAYNQPISRDEVERIRGKSSGSIMTQLLRRELLTVIDGEAKSGQRKYATTEKFLDLFGLTDLEDLPQSHEASGNSEFAD